MIRSRPWTALSKTATMQRRCLHASPFLQVSVITFNKSGSPKLQEALNLLREKIILPTYLSPEQQEQRHKSRNKKKLDTDPITLEIDGEVVKFGFQDRFELPNTWKVFQDIYKNMNTKVDFDNLRPALEGLKKAHRHLPHHAYTKLIAKAYHIDALDTILDCVRAVKKTHFKLDHHEKVATLLTAIQTIAVQSGWKKAELEKALKRTQSILDALEAEPVHKPSAKQNSEKWAFPLYRDPLILSSRLHMAAALAAKHNGGKDVDGVVAKYAQELLSLWPQSAGLGDMYPASGLQNEAYVKYLVDPHSNRTLWVLANVQSGLKLAAQVAEPTLAKELLNRTDAIEKDVQAALAVAQGKAEKNPEYVAVGLEVYKKVNQAGESAA
ncbi:hypothetical protein B0H63DRAFT_399789 [Podospora didyma]|uniref:Uncharacterized protein n=1 Tax=Podospora didyma TaxID=330526 RepID=A0AAE0KGQ3_9PEZI|nr:hypothetical protein B0H63DRAFT_399789 [Podospora didyma]